MSNGIKLGLWEEAEELTAAAVREYLERMHWKRCPAHDTRKWEVWRLNDGADGSVYLDKAKPFEAVEQLSRMTERSVQSLLRSICPRLAPWPSAAARMAYDGPWLAVCPEDGTACMGRFRKDVQWFAHSGNLILTVDDTFARYWPCDEHGNKVPWPKDENGAPL